MTSVRQLRMRKVMSLTHNVWSAVNVKEELDGVRKSWEIVDAHLSKSAKELAARLGSGVEPVGSGTYCIVRDIGAYSYNLLEKELKHICATHADLLSQLSAVFVRIRLAASQGEDVVQRPGDDPRPDDTNEECLSRGALEHALPRCACMQLTDFVSKTPCRWLIMMRFGLLLGALKTCCSSLGSSL
jgi:hypothetical protein